MDSLTLSDAHLARLKRLLSYYDKESLVDDLINNSPSDRLLKVHSALKDAQLEKIKEFLPFDEFMKLSIDECVLKLASYPTFDESHSSLFDAWLNDANKPKAAVATTHLEMQDNREFEMDDDAEVKLLMKVS